MIYTDCSGLYGLNLNLKKNHIGFSLAEFGNDAEIII